MSTAVENLSIYNSWEYLGWYYDRIKGKFSFKASIHPNHGCELDRNKLSLKVTPMWHPVIDEKNNINMEAELPHIVQISSNDPETALIFHEMFLFISKVIPINTPNIFVDERRMFSTPSRDYWLIVEYKEEKRFLGIGIECVIGPGFEMEWRESYSSKYGKPYSAKRVREVSFGVQGEMAQTTIAYLLRESHYHLQLT